MQTREINIAVEGPHAAVPASPGFADDEDVEVEEGAVRSLTHRRAMPPTLLALLDKVLDRPPEPRPLLTRLPLVAPPLPMPLKQSCTWSEQQARTTGSGKPSQSAENGST
jgi:hypothetical protein